MRLLIVNNLFKNVLASIRSLGKSDYDITIDIACFDQASIHRLLKSRYLHKVFTITNPVKNFSDFNSDLDDLISKNHYDMVIPFGFIATVALSKLKDRLQNKDIIVPTGDFNTIIKAHDKKRCFDIAESLGLSIPYTYNYDNIDELEKNIRTYPIIIKARRFSGIRKGFAIINDYGELKDVYNRMTAQAGDGEIVDFSKPVIQEFIDGDIYDSCFFVSNGEVKSFLFQQRVMSTAGKIGPGIINESLNNDLKHKAYDYGRCLLKEIGWEGCCQVELIFDRQEQEFKLIEVNPKLWGTLELSIIAGVDFPLNMIRHYYFNESINVIDYPSIKFYWIWNIALYMAKQKKLDLKELSNLIRKENNEIDCKDFRPEIYKFIDLISRIIKGK